MNCCGGGIWQPNTNFLGSGKGFSCAPLMYNAWSVSSVWQEMSWNDPGVSSDQKRFTYFSLALNPFRIFGEKYLQAGEPSQMNCICKLQITQQDRWRILLYPLALNFLETCIAQPPGGFWRSCTATLLSHMLIEQHVMLWSLSCDRSSSKMLCHQACFGHLSQSCPWLISTLWKHAPLDQVFTHNLPMHTLSMLLCGGDCVWKKCCGTTTKVSSKPWVAKIIRCACCDTKVN